MDAIRDNSEQRGGAAFNAEEQLLFWAVDLWSDLDSNNEQACSINDSMSTQAAKLSTVRPWAVLIHEIPVHQHLLAMCSRLAVHTHLSGAHNSALQKVASLHQQ